MQQQDFINFVWTFVLKNGFSMQKKKKSPGFGWVCIVCHDDVWLDGLGDVPQNQPVSPCYTAQTALYS